MQKTYKILIMGASYGSLLGTKLALAGHTVHLICLPAEAELINKEGAIVRMPIKGREGLVEINSRKAPGKLSAGGTQGVNPGDYDLVALAMQEPQYRSPGVRELLDAVAKAKVPCMSIMNMPPLPYLKRIPGLNADACRSCYTDPTVWDSFDPKLLTLCSPDPQAFRPPEDKVNVLQVRLPTNFKSARCGSTPVAARSNCPSSSRCTNRCLCRWRSGACCWPATIAACRKMPRAASKKPCTPTSKPRARSTAGWPSCACLWARPRKTWYRLKNMPLRHYRC